MADRKRLSVLNRLLAINVGLFALWIWAIIRSAQNGHIGWLIAIILVGIVAPVYLLIHPAGAGSPSGHSRSRRRSNRGGGGGGSRGHRRPLG